VSLFEENMPIYQYQCESCGHELEALQKISAEPLTECPECKEPRLVKQVTAPNFRLKGSGWYETDFKTSNQKNLANKDSSSS
jgi:putative FmdB family regulatory protein